MANPVQLAMRGVVVGGAGFLGYQGAAAGERVARGQSESATGVAADTTAAAIGASSVATVAAWASGNRKLLSTVGRLNGPIGMAYAAALLAHTAAKAAGVDDDIDRYAKKAADAVTSGATYAAQQAGELGDHALTEGAAFFGDIGDTVTAGATELGSYADDTYDQAGQFAGRSLDGASAWIDDAGEALTGAYDAAAGYATDATRSVFGDERSTLGKLADGDVSGAFGDLVGSGGSDGLLGGAGGDQLADGGGYFEGVTDYLSGFANDALEGLNSNPITARATPGVGPTSAPAPSRDRITATPGGRSRGATAPKHNQPPAPSQLQQAANTYGITAAGQAIDSALDDAGTAANWAYNSLFGEAQRAEVAPSERGSAMLTPATDRSRMQSVQQGLAGNRFTAGAAAPSLLQQAGNSLSQAANAAPGFASGLIDAPTPGAAVSGLYSGSYLEAGVNGLSGGLDTAGDAIGDAYEGSYLESAVDGVGDAASGIGTAANYAWNSLFGQAQRAELAPAERKTAGALLYANAPRPNHLDPSKAASGATEGVQAPGLNPANGKVTAPSKGYLNDSAKARAAKAPAKASPKAGAGKAAKEQGPKGRQTYTKKDGTTVQATKGQIAAYEGRKKSK